MIATVVVAHPDDETIFFGGTIRRLARAGVRVEVVCATSTFASEGVTAIRRNEFRRACSLLGARARLLRVVEAAGLLDETVLACELDRALVGLGRGPVLTHGVWESTATRTTPRSRWRCIAARREPGRSLAPSSRRCVWSSGRSSSTPSARWRPRYTAASRSLRAGAARWRATPAGRTTRRRTSAASHWAFASMLPRSGRRLSPAASPTSTVCRVWCGRPGTQSGFAGCQSADHQGAGSPATDFSKERRSTGHISQTGSSRRPRRSRGCRHLWPKDRAAGRPGRAPMAPRRRGRAGLRPRGGGRWADTSTTRCHAT